MLSAGKDVLSFCNRCKLTLSHTIVSMLGPLAPGKVQCNTCKGIHRFKDPSAAKVKKASSPRVKKESTLTPLKDIWKKAIEESVKNPEDYSIRKSFKAGDLVNHPKFGLGVVEKIIDREKVDIMFQFEVKTLAQNKS